ncbi:hypothetical protein MMC13_005798 [Lambiella insularis]|nr:hypothetical protein [Lambiella insularis]
MPPQRTIPPAKAIKTERTHEENQERAYIAASRRSDRSLEARVESARRASEIHKRRTGRSLRVTEQDVVNEEMYEEEDDDLPLQYRRLTAHLQTGSADFNRRLAAYLTNHVAMRSALDQAITNSYAQQYPNAPQFAHNQQTMYPSPLTTQGLPQQSYQPQQVTQQSPHPYRQSPYPTPGAPGYRQHSHNRSSLSSTSLDLPGQMQVSPVEGIDQASSRRMSMPTTSMTPSTIRAPPSFQQSQAPATPKQASHKVESHSPTPQATIPPNLQSMGPPSTSSSTPKSVQAPLLPQYNTNSYQDFGPLTMSLPPESQMLLGSTLDSNDPFTSMLMAGSENFAQPFFSNNLSLNTTNMPSKQSGLHPSYDGMSATLAPSALNMSPSRVSSGESCSATSEPMTTPSYNFNFENNLGDFKGVGGYLQCGNGNASGTVTPGIDGSWDAFINESSWAENAT